MGAPTKFFWCGSLGAGLAAKISNNYLSCSQMLAISEAMAIGIRQGVDPSLLHEVISNSSGQSWVLDHDQPAPDILPHVSSSNGYKPGFRTHMAIKDLGLGIEAAEAIGIEPTVARAALGVYQEAAHNPKCIVGPASEKPWRRKLTQLLMQDRNYSSVFLHITEDET